MMEGGKGERGGGGEVTGELRVYFLADFPHPQIYCYLSNVFVMCCYPDRCAFKFGIQINFCFIGTCWRGMISS